LKKKIAVCIPSYNESHIISATLSKIDKGLKKYIKLNYDVIIVNIDNNSPDNTSDIFMNTNTICPKISIKTNEIGKGTNLLEFFKYCKNNDIDYAITIDADVRTVKPIWIDKFLEPLINNNYDYVTPIYKRSRYEGSTTNHFAFPLIYAISGIPIRQPIAGDFSFNKKFINIINEQEITDSTKRYGIDIFMTLVACYKKLNVYQINLEKKIHNPSYTKIESMFQEVLDSFLFTWKNLYKQGNKFDNKKDNYSFNCIVSSRKFNHKQRAIEMLNEYSAKISDTNDIEEKWLEKLFKLILCPEKITEKERNEMFHIFMVRATSFWLQSEKYSANRCENIIDNQANKLYEMVRMKGE